MISNLQILRAFAALNVVIAHSIGTANSYDFTTDFLSVLEGWGANGVDIFFVISGFVMLHTQMNKKRTVVDFLKSRVIRIVPIYWILTSVVITIYILVPSAFAEMVITPEWAVASYIFMSGLISNTYPIVHVGWTLEWEMLFYIAFALSLKFRTWLQSLAFLSIILLFVAVASSNFIILEFLGGVLVALIYKKEVISRSAGRIVLLVGFALLCLSILPSVRELITSRVLLWGVPSLLIVLGTLTVTQLSNKVGELLGDASYSIYLIQILSIPVFYKLASKLGIALNTDVLAILCVLASATGGVLMYLLLEKPLTNILRKRFA